MAVSKALWMYRGDSHTVSVFVKSESSTGVQTAINIASATGKLSVKTKHSATAYLFTQVDGVVEDAPTGEMSFTIPPAATQDLNPGVYVYDVQVTLASGAVYTVASDTFEIKADVTRPA